MIEPIVIKVTDKVPKLFSAPYEIVCDNSDYSVVWQLDEEWAQFESRTMIVRYRDGTHDKVLFKGNTCNLPAIPVDGHFYVGLFAGDIHTTKPLQFFAKRSAQTDSGEERDPMPDGYAQAIKALDEKLDKNQGANNAGKALVIGDNGNVVPGEVKGSGSYTLPVASPTQLGGVKPVAKTDVMTKDVGVDANGGLYTEPDSVYYIDLEGAFPNFTTSKTNAEIHSAYRSGRTLVCRFYQDDNRWTLPLLSPTLGLWLFGAVISTGKPVDVDTAQGIAAIVGNGQGIVTQIDLATKADIPTALPNPNALTIKVGDTTTAYDGSVAKTVKVPDGNNPLDITGAQVGQIAKITAVDTDGKPTKWEPVDMAGGEEVWENLTFSIPENDPVSAATINLPSTNIVKVCIQISLFGTLANTKFGVMVFTGSTTEVQFLPADINEFYTTAQQIRTANIVLEKKADSWQSIFNTNAVAGGRNDTGALRLTSYNSDFLYIKTPTANETFYGTIKVNYVIGG